MKKCLLGKKKSFQSRNPLRKRYGIRYLKPVYLQFLIDSERLRNWGAHTLKHRCVLFHRQFPDHRINPTLLTKVYNLHKIKRKKVKFVKHIDPNKEIEYEQWRLDIQQKIRELKEQHYRIIYLDETIFTTKTIQRLAYSPVRTNVRLP